MDHEEKEMKFSEYSFNINVGDRAICENFEVSTKAVTKPKHHTEATLLGSMETAGRNIEDEALREAMKEKGLGTPATRAQIIETLKSRQYVEEKGQRIVSTIKGRQLISLVDETIKSPEMTGQWEKKLKEMERGAFTYQKFMGEVEQYVKGLNSTYTGKNAEDFSDLLHRGSQRCPGCKKGYIKKTDIGWFCSEGKEKCGFVLWKKVAGKKLTDNQLAQLLEKGETGKIKGFKNKQGKPFEAKLKILENKVSFIFD